jgi:hypothetical protein
MIHRMKKKIITQGALQNHLSELEARSRPQKYQKIGEKAKWTQQGICLKIEWKTVALWEVGYGDISSFFSRQNSISVPIRAEDEAQTGRKCPWGDGEDDEGLTAVNLEIGNMWAGLDMGGDLREVKKSRIEL